MNVQKKNFCRNWCTRLLAWGGRKKGGAGEKESARARERVGRRRSLSKARLHHNMRNHMQKYPRQFLVVMWCDTAGQHVMALHQSAMATGGEGLGVGVRKRRQKAPYTYIYEKGRRVCMLEKRPRTRNKRTQQKLWQKRKGR